MLSIPQLLCTKMDTIYVQSSNEKVPRQFFQMHCQYIQDSKLLSDFQRKTRLHFIMTAVMLFRQKLAPLLKMFAEKESIKERHKSKALTIFNVSDFYVFLHLLIRFFHRKGQPFHTILLRG